jgi:hypothetical protein
MKFKRMILGLVMAIGLMVSAAPAMAQVGTVPRVTQLTNTVNWTNGSAVVYVPAGSSTNVNIIVPLYKDRGMAFFPCLYGTNAGTANVAFLGQYGYILKYWGATTTNWTTTTPFNYTVPMNGTTVVTGYTNIIRDGCDNFQLFKLTQITNGHTASVVVSNMVTSVFP